MVASPADVKIVYTVAGVSKSITLLRLPSLSTFQYAMHCRFATLTYHQISLKRTSFHSCDTLICLPWLNLEESTTLLFILFL